MKFKDYEDYKNQRVTLINAAQGFLTENKMDDFNAKTKEVEELDNAWDAFAKAQADLNALNGSAKPQINVLDMTSTNSVIAKMDAIDNDLDHRKAFMNYVLKGEQMPTVFHNANENTKTTDIGELIPETVLARIIEKIEASGMILPLVTRTAYKGGLTIPTSNVKPKAIWVSEGAGSDRQKKTLSGSVTFAYHKLRCAVSVSLEVDTMALPVFETTLINNVSEAMLRALEEAIMNGSGVGQPKGILTETAPAGQELELAGDPTYKTLIEAEAALPLSYESGAVWFMTKGMFMAFAGMTDSAGQPVARTTYGITGRPERVLLGRNVVLNEYMPSYTAAEVDDVVAFLFNPKDYILNTNLNMTMKRYEDNDTDDQVTKAVMLVDGRKVIDNSSLVVLKKKA